MLQLTLKKKYTFEDLLQIEKEFIINYCKTPHLIIYLEVEEIFKRQKEYDAKSGEEVLYIICPSEDPIYLHIVLVNDMLRSDLFEEGDCNEEDEDD